MKHSKRRYRSGLHLLYDNAYDRLRINSEILNGADLWPNAHTTFYDKDGLQSARLELAGNEKGEFLRSGEFRKAKIPATESQLLNIEERFKIHQTNLREQGYRVSDSFPPQLNDEKLLTEARLDVLKEELDEVDRRLETYKVIEKRDDDSKVLQYGLLCFGKLHNGKLETIDYQDVAEIAGTMVIIDDRSPYNGLAVSTYRELAEKWRLDRKEADKKLLLKLQAEAKLKNETPPAYPPTKAVRKVAKASLPPFPKDAKNYLQDENDSEP